MKKSLLACILFFSLLLSTSCQRGRGADEVLRNFSASFGGAIGTIYSSEAREGEKEYLSREMLATLYGLEEIPLYDSVALMLFADMDGVVEYGVFLIRSGAGRLDDITLTQEMCAYRISQISHIFSDAEGVVLRYGNAVVYFVTEDNQRAERLFSSLL